MPLSPCHAPVPLVGHSTGWGCACSLYIGDGGLELLVALRDSPNGVAPLLWLRYGSTTMVEHTHPGPQQCRETGISADALRASPPLWGLTAYCGEDWVMPSDAAWHAPLLWRRPAACTNTHHHCG